MPSKVLHGCICITWTLQPLELCWSLKITTAVVRGDCDCPSLEICHIIHYHLKTENTVQVQNKCSMVKAWKPLADVMTHQMHWKHNSGRGGIFQVKSASCVICKRGKDIWVDLVYGKMWEKVKWHWRNEYFTTLAGFFQTTLWL